MRITVIGLGRMGLPIASRLTKRHSVTGYDIAKLAAPPAFPVAQTVHEACIHTEVLITVLPGPGELRRALLGETSALESVPPGTLWIDMTSCDPTTGAELHSAAAGSDIRRAALSRAPQQRIRTRQQPSVSRN